jgi:hypothetical protein
LENIFLLCYNNLLQKVALNVNRNCLLENIFILLTLNLLIEKNREFFSHIISDIYFFIRPFGVKPVMKTHFGFDLLILINWRNELMYGHGESPAPKPLSIFTTASPDAHEFNIPNNADTPLKFVPYPILVGTPITGLLTRPATTLGKAPSIPAQTIIVTASRIFGSCSNNR